MFVVGVPRVGPRQSAKVQFVHNQIAVVSPGATVPHRQFRQREAPEEALQAARARVAKLEAAISAVGVSDPTFPALQEALRQARKHAQVQPVESQVKSSEFFIERAKKCVEK